MKDIIIIGAGASGLMASIYAAKKGKKVTIIEKNSQPGKKLLITGNGKCNYFNEDNNINHYHTNNIELLKNIINDNNRQEILDTFNNLGIIPKINEGYYYPYSNQATSIQTALIKEAKLNNVEIITDTTVLNVKKENNIFIVETNNNTYKCNKLVLSTGGKASSKTGSDGFGYKIASNFNHKINEILPALCPLTSNTKYLKEWHGIRSDVKINLYSENNLINIQTGEIQLTDYGVSGICIFNLSGQVSTLLYNNKKANITINFMYPFNINENNFIEFMNNRNNKINNRSVSELLDGLLNYKLINLMLKLSHINKDESWNNIPKNNKITLANYLTNHKLEITGTLDFDRSQTSTGGILLEDININTLESLIENNLYFTGEMLDVYADCGGYNLTFAFITGMIVGKNI